MAAAPAYAPTPVLWCGLIPGTADTSWTAPTHVTALGTAGTAGTKIVQIHVIPAGGTVVAGLVNVFAYDGTTYHCTSRSPSRRAPCPDRCAREANLLLRQPRAAVIELGPRGHRHRLRQTPAWSRVNAFGASL